MTKKNADETEDIMAELTEEERERQREERELLKEEKRRFSQQKALEAERTARKKAALDAMRLFVTNTSGSAKKVKDRTFHTICETARYGVRTVDRLMVFFSKSSAVLVRLVTKCWRGATVFAAKPIAVPISILSVMLVYLGIIYTHGYQLFGLETHPPTFQFYVCDYSVGFCSRLFIGAVISLFTDKVSIALMNRIVNIAVCTSLVGQAVVAGLLMRTGLKNKSPVAAVIGLFFMTNPLSVLENLFAPGLLDVYLLVLFLFWLGFLKTPLCVLVTPIVCFIGIAIHYEFLFTFLPPLLTLLLYYAFFAEKRRVRIGRGIAFASGSAVSAATFFYFVFLAKDHLKMTSDVFYEHMLSRISMTPTERECYIFLMGRPIFRDYFDYYIFGEYHGDSYYENVGDFFEFLRQWNMSRFSVNSFLKNMVMFLPVFLVLAVIWGKCAAKESSIRKLPYVCFIGQALVLVPELIISTDIWRWVSAALLSQFFVFAVVYFDIRSVVRQILDETRLQTRIVSIAFVAVFTYVVGCLIIM